MEESKQKLETAQKELEALKTELLNNEKELSSAETILADSNADLVVKKQLLEAAEKLVAEKEKDLSVAVATKAAFEKALQEAEAELQRLQSETPQDAGKIAAQQGIVNGIKDDVQKADTAITQAQSSLNNASSAADAAKQDKDNVQKVIDTSTTSIAAIEKAISGNKADIGDKQNSIIQLIKDADSNTFENIPALKGLTDANAAISAINQEISVIAPKITAAESKQNILEAEAAKAEKAAADALNAAGHSGISTDGDLNLKLENGGSIGENNNSLGITVGGELAVSTGNGSKADNMYLESGGNLTVGNLSAQGDIKIDSMGDIKASDSVSGAAISAVNATLTSANGSIGSKDTPLTTDVESLVAKGDNVSIANDKSLKIDTIIGGSVNIKADGDITAGNSGNGNNNIVSDDLDVTAKGDIGSSGSAIKVDTGSINSSSDNLYADTDNSISIGAINAGNKVDITAGGNIANQGTTGSGINAGNLNLNAGGSIGQKDDPLNTNVSGETSSKAELGNSTLSNSYSAPSSNSGGGTASSAVTLEDKATGVTVSGDISGKLSVTIVKQHSEDGCILCQIREALGDQNVLLAYDINITGTHKGILTVEIPVDKDFNGKVLTVIYKEDGKTISKDVTVSDGKITLKVSALGRFVVLNKQYTVMVYSKNDITVIDNKNIPMPSDRFHDVLTSDWFFESIGFMYGLGLMNGVDEDEFNPRGNISRGMLATILYRFAGSPKAEGNNSNVTAGMWYTDGMIWAIETGIINNYEADKEVTREQFVTMLYRMAVLRGWSLSGDYDLTKFIDGDKVSDYAHDAMVWATANGLIRGREDNNIAPNGPITRAEVSILLHRVIQQFEPSLLLIVEQ